VERNLRQEFKRISALTRRVIPGKIRRGAGKAKQSRKDIQLKNPLWVTGTLSHRGTLGDRLEPTLELSVLIIRKLKSSYNFFSLFMML
jgi:hypothetical protein